MGIKSDLLKTVVKKKKAAKTEFEKAHAIAQSNASLPIEQGGLGLPPDNTAMDRARAMGFDKDVYHGSYSDITNIDPSKFSDRVDYMKGFFTANSPEVAGNYGDVIYPLKQKSGVQVSDRRLARREGREVSDLDTVFDAWRGVNVTNNPSNIRSVNAAFDPLKRNSSDILGATTAQGVGTLAALSGGAAAIYDAAKNDKLGEATNYAQDAANMVGYIPSGGLLTTSDIIGGVAKAGAAATGNLDAYNENLAPYVERAGETKSGLGKAVEGVIGYGVEKASPYVSEAAAPIVSNVQGQWQRIEDTPGDANLFGFAQELNRKLDTKLFQSQAQIDAYNAKRNARRSRKQTK